MEKAANKGNLEAQATLSYCYYKGEGVEQDIVKAVGWSYKAAEQGLAEAQSNLGTAYYYGEGVEKDLSKAVEWWRKAANQGFADAQHNLGIAYSHGKGVKKDLSKAVEWWYKAAEQECVRAQFNLALAYYEGLGMEKDLVKAAKWYMKAAEQGLDGAQNNLGNLYSNGEGVEKNLVEAVKWYRKAAEQGYALAQFNLGGRYYFGEGVEKDLVKAAEWIHKASENGHKKAQDILKNDKSLQIASPFGLQIGRITLEQVEKLYKFKKSGINKWTNGSMCNIEPVSQVNLKGIKEVTLIFDDQSILQAVITKFEKDRFEGLLNNLVEKYVISYKQVPMVGNRIAEFLPVNGLIELKAIHLSDFTSLDFYTSKFKALFIQKLTEDMKLEKQKEKDAL